MSPRKKIKLSNKENDEPAKYVPKLYRDFDVGESLGEGSFGQIIKVKRKSDENEYAIKMIKFNSNMQDAETFRREAEVLAKLSHNNIVRYFDSWIETSHIPFLDKDKIESDKAESLCSEFEKLSQNDWIEDSNGCDYDYKDEDKNENDKDEIKEDLGYKQSKYLFIQMELCGKCNLRTVIDNNLYLEENRLNKYFKEICEGLSYIHKKNIVHRDLKPENIFVTSDDVIKIGDFGVSKQILLKNEFEAQQFDKLPYGSLTDVCGTSVYIAPELYYGDKFNVKADIYSLGVIYFEMCSKPMTGAQKRMVFPIAIQAWGTITFSTNNDKKKFLVKKLLHRNHHERPTCAGILTILDSKNRRVPNEQMKTFKKALKLNSVRKNELTEFLLNAAVKIFKLHGGLNIPMPTFLPSYTYHSDNLTTMLYGNEYSTSVSNTSRIAFSYYVANNKIRKIRRYSTGKSFEEGSFSPTEIQECLFQAVSPEPDNHVTEAEMLYIAQEVCDNIFPEDEDKICLLINHSLIFSTVLKHCRISANTASVFSEINKMNPDVITGTSIKTFSSLGAGEKVKSFLLKMMEGYLPESAEEQIMSLFGNNTDKKLFAKIDIDFLHTAFSQMKKIAQNARKFGVKSKILIRPLLINQRNSPDFMFKVTYKGKKIIANGGRFESFIKACSRTNKTSPNFSAVEVSFNVESILRLLGSPHNSSRDLDVMIVAEDNSDAISFYTALLSKEIKCEIVNKRTFSDKPTTQRPLIKIELNDEDNCTVYLVNKSGEWKLQEVFSGNWKNESFFQILSDHLASHRLPQTIFYQLPSQTAETSGFRI